MPFIAAALATSTALPATTVEITVQGTTRFPASERLEAVKYWFQDLMLSAVYRDVVLESSAQEWAEVARSGSKIDWRSDSTETLALPERKQVSFDEVILPLPSGHYPDYIYVRSAGRFQKLAKFDPWVLHKLTVEIGLQLYPQLNSVERGIF
jgi:hypothetical protein